MKEAAKDHIEPAPEPHAPCDFCYAILAGVVVMFATGNLAIVLMLLK